MSISSGVQAYDSDARASKPNSSLKKKRDHHSRSSVDFGEQQQLVSARGAPTEMTRQLQHNPSHGMISHEREMGLYGDESSVALTAQHVPQIKGQQPMMVNSASEVMKKRNFLNNHMKTANVSQHNSLTHTDITAGK